MRRPLGVERLLFATGFLALMAGQPAEAGNIDHCITNDKDRLVNLCDFRISVRYCCHGSEWYGCDRSAKIGWGDDPGYHEWMPPRGRVGMACDPDKGGWRWAGCRLPPKGERGEAGMGPYGWDMKSTRGLKCADDARAGSVSSVGKRDGRRAALRARVRANVRSGPGTEYGKVGLLEAGEEVRVTGEAGTWLRIETAAGDQAFVHGSLLIGVEPGAAPDRKDAEDRRRAALEKSRKKWCEKHRWVLNPKTETVIWKACVVGGKPVLLHASEAQDAFKRGICDSLMDWRVKWLLDESGLFRPKGKWLRVEDSVFPHLVSEFELDDLRAAQERCRR